MHQCYDSGVWGLFLWIVAIPYISVEDLGASGLEKPGKDAFPGDNAVTLELDNNGGWHSHSSSR